jgi:hypothetical protein
MDVSPGTNREELLAVALAAGQPFVHAAAEAGVCERTARRRLSEPGFRRKVAALRRAIRTRAIEIAAGQLAAGGKH